jgi:uncharacterized protein (TIGR03435 family)
VRHGVWLAASCKFLIPLSVLVALGSNIRWQAVSDTTQSNWSLVMEEVSQPFTAPAVSSPSLPNARPASSPLLGILFGIWACGFAGISGLWWIRWRRIKAIVRAGSPVHMEIPIPARSSRTSVEPGVFGVFRPVLLLPEDVCERLAPTQLQAVIAHELCHVRHRDNLIAAIHMAVENIFWFHPLVWWIGKRMVEERERACDEEVIRLGNNPNAYAEGILKVCKLYVESPLVCASGVTGSNLRKRIEQIMAHRNARNLDWGRKSLLAVAGALAVAGPIAMGVMCASSSRAQSQSVLATSPVFEVASVKPARSGEERSLTQNPGARLTTSNATVRMLIMLAYQVMPDQISGGPNWLESDGFDIDAKGKNPKATQALFRQMIQSLLADRFQLRVHRETKELPVYALVLAKNGTKLVEAKDDDSEVSMRIEGPGQLTGVKATMPMFATALSKALKRRVVDESGLKGAYNFKLQFVPDQKPPRLGEDGSPPIGDGPSIFAALQEQLGLNLRASKGPIEILVIDHAERPTAN